MSELKTDLNNATLCNGLKQLAYTCVFITFIYANLKQVSFSYMCSRHIFISKDMAHFYINLRNFT